MELEIITTLIGTLITAITTIVVAIIQKPSSSNTQTPPIALPPGYIKPSPKPRKTWFFVLPFTVLGGIIGYFIGSWITPPDTPTPFFIDNFCSAGVDIGVWDVLSEGFYTDNCRLIADYENNNSNSGWGEQLIQAKINERFLTVEFKAEVNESTQIAKIGIETSCNDNSLFFELKGDKRLKGYNDENLEKWEYIIFQGFKFNQAYTIRLVQEGDGVHVFIDNIEMKNVLPCSNMGQYLNISAGGETGQQISGFFEYVYLWQESVLP